MKEICEYCYSELVEESEKIEGNKAFIWKRCSNPDCNVTFLVVKYLWQINDSQFDSMMVVAK